MELTDNKTTEFSFALKKSDYGVGVFAVHNIKKDTHLRLFGDLGESEEVTIMRNKEEIPDFFKQYCIHRGEQMIAPRDFGCLEVGFFLNHSKTPNTYHINFEYYAKREIKAGEEILIDYNHLLEPDDMKEDYYR